MEKFIKPVRYPSEVEGKTEHDVNHREVPDSKPCELVLVLGQEVLTQNEIITRSVNQALSRLESAREVETLKDSLDWTVDDPNAIPITQYEDTGQTVILEPPAPPDPAPAPPDPAPAPPGPAPAPPTPPPA